MSQTEDRGTRAYMSTGRGDTQRVFRAARRHSRLVRALRVAIPAGAVIAVGAMILAATVFDPLRALAKLPISYDRMVVSGTKIITRAPRLSGLTQDRRRYVVTAKSATKDLTKPDSIELDDLHATFETKDTGEYQLTAPSGVFESKSDRLTLRDNIVVTSASYQARLIEAVINVRTNHVVSEKPVEVIMQQGTINANRLEILESGNVVRFEGGVTVVMTSQSDKPVASAGAR